jgi:predicted ATPase
MSLITAQLPVRLTPLVGRESELNDIVHAVTRARLLTLTGPGGTGKTRLALAAAGSARESFPAGVCWVELAQIEDPGSVAPTVASRLGVPDTPGQDATDAVAGYLADHQVLVVLDNCEHLAGATALLTESLLAACPALTIMATSRETLGVEGELNWQVPPLSLPEAGSALTASALATSGAVKLFEQRAQLVRPSFRVTDENAAQVASICQRLDGLPLAIELAAPRMRIMSSAQLAERLDDIFALLVGGARSAPPRHQALRATLDWSHDLLDAEERAAFRRLAAFAGGFTLEAAERVAAGGDIKPASMLELLTRLADKSLLRVEHSRGDSRYHLLVTIRDYARDRLAEAAESDSVRRAHLAYFTELVETAAASPDRGRRGGGRRPGARARPPGHRAAQPPQGVRVRPGAGRPGGGAADRRPAGPVRLPARPLRRDPAVDGRRGDLLPGRARRAGGQGAARQRPAGPAAVRLRSGRAAAGGRAAPVP